MYVVGTFSLFTSNNFIYTQITLFDKRIFKPIKTNPAQLAGCAKCLVCCTVCMASLKALAALVPCSNAE